MNTSQNVDVYVSCKGKVIFSVSSPPMSSKTEMCMCITTVVIGLLILGHYDVIRGFC